MAIDRSIDLKLNILAIISTYLPAIFTMWQISVLN
jgi:hypothetical protein